MLASLRKLDQRTREAMLAALALDLLPNAEAGEGVAPERHLLFEDLCREVGVSPDDQSAESRRRVRDVLSIAIRRLILNPSRIKEIRERVGRQGLLPLSAYELHFSDLFRMNAVPLGVSEDLAGATIQRGQFVRHLASEKFSLPDDDGVSLFLVNNLDVPDRHSVVIFAIRKNDKLRVDDGWLVFHSEIRPCDLSDPLDVLQALTDRYGLYIDTGGERRKFILYEILPILGAGTQPIRIENPSGRKDDIHAHFSYRVQRLSVEIAVAFAINVTAYASDLRRHQVRITRQIPE